MGQRPFDMNFPPWPPPSRKVGPGSAVVLHEPSVNVDCDAGIGDPGAIHQDVDAPCAQSASSSAVATAALMAAALAR